MDELSAVPHLPASLGVCWCGGNLNGQGNSPLGLLLPSQGGGWLECWIIGNINGKPL